MSQQRRNMFDSSSSDDDNDPGVQAKKKHAAASMKSLFTSEERSRATAESRTLKYEGPDRSRTGSMTRDTARASVTGGSATAGPAAPPQPGAKESNVVLTQRVEAYKGETFYGMCFALVVSTPGKNFIAIIDKEKRGQAKVHIASDLQFIQNTDEPRYASLFDPQFNLHWSLLFATPLDCLTFICSALTLQHYALLSEGPRPMYEELATATEPPLLAKGDRCYISMAAWLLKKVAGSTVGTTSTCLGKIVEEIADDAPRRITLGEKTVMTGVEDALVGMGAGGKKLLFLSPKKTKVSGLGNPEIGPEDSVAVVVTVHSIETADQLLGDKKQTERGGGESPQAHETQQPLAIMPTAQPSAPAAPAPAPAAPSTTDQLLQAFLLSQISNQQKASAPPPEPAPSHHQQEAHVPAHVERSLDRINQQLSALYEKMDRLDFESKITANNEKLERIVKKAVGKMPVNDIDIEDMSKDRDQLLAKIESLKQRTDEMTDNYHSALHQIGKHKEEVAGLKNDITIERDTAKDRIRELKERKRLELVDLEVRHRSEMDKAIERAKEEGKEAGFAEGYQTGKMDGLSVAGSQSTDELKEIVVKKDQRIVELQQRIAELEKRSFEERRTAAEEQDTLQGLISRLEARETLRQKDIIDDGHANVKRLRRTLNDVYAGIEEQFYATGKESIEVSEALTMVLVTVKQHARLTAEEIKQAAQIKAQEPIVMPENAATIAKQAGDPEPETSTDSNSKLSRLLPREEAEPSADQAQNEELDELKRYLKERDEEEKREREKAEREEEERLHGVKAGTVEEERVARTSQKEPEEAHDDAGESASGGGGGLDLDEMAKRYGLDLNELSKSAPVESHEQTTTESGGPPPPPPPPMMPRMNPGSSSSIIDVAPPADDEPPVVSFDDEPPRRAAPIEPSTDRDVSVPSTEQAPEIKSPQPEKPSKPTAPPAATGSAWADDDSEDEAPRRPIAKRGGGLPKPKRPKQGSEEDDW